jgi:NADH-quinone oxidoreductase subunit H
MGSGQKRLGPNVIGYEGLLQPLADGLKLFSKETILPANSNTFLFLLAPMILFTLSFLGWSVIPYNFGNVLCDLNLGFFLILSISSMNVYSILLAGWSSNSIYAFCGAVRSIAQMISYEISLGFLISVIVYCSGSLNLSDIVRSQYLVWFCFCFPLLFIMFFIVLLAETNRHPFDLPEAESELVSGYNVEYSGMLFALFFLGEYANILFTSALSTVIFFGGWLAPFTISILTFGGNFWFGIKSTLFVFINCLTRISVPRYRHDQLMSLCWKVFLPVSLYYLMTTLSSFSLIF